MRIGVVGTGGLGGYFGGRLARAGADVHFVARGAHLAALRSDGLRVRSVRGDFELPVNATDDPAEIGACDVVLVCVKSFDTEAAAASLPPLLHDRTGVLTLQNGVDNEEKLAAAIGEERVLGGAAYILASISEPGVIRDAGGPGGCAVGRLQDPDVSRLGAPPSAGDTQMCVGVTAVVTVKSSFTISNESLKRSGPVFLSGSSAVA